MSIIVTPLIQATKVEWLAFQQPIIQDRVVYESDTGNFKIGDGVSTYGQLPYFNNLTPASFLVLVDLLNIIPFVDSMSSSTTISTGSSISGGIPGQVLISEGTLAPSWSTLLMAPEPSSFSGSIEIQGSYNETFSTVASLGIIIEGNGIYTDGNIVLEPLGIGGIILGGFPDGTSTGGNVRGINAIDLQNNRTAPTQIVSGDYSVITGGKDNSNAGNLSVIGGGNSNIIDPGVTTSVVVGGEANAITSGQGTPDHAVIVGGYQNQNGGQYALIGGGYGNFIATAGTTFSIIVGGIDNQINTPEGFIGGGSSNNLVGGETSSIVGGTNNSISQANSFIGGGQNNIINLGGSGFAVITGGFYNQTSTQLSFIGGGTGNQISGNTGSVIVGGDTNNINAEDAFIGGGYQNTLQDDYSGIVAGYQNQSIGGQYNFLGGGNTNQLQTCTYSCILGGQDNTIYDSDFAIVLGGSGNYTYQADYSFIGSGQGNEVDYTYAIIVGGQSNYAESFSVIVNGTGNEATGQYAFIGNGYDNESQGQYGCVITGLNNFANGQCAYVGTGEGNNASLPYTIVLNGMNNAASALNATVINGSGNSVSGNFSTVMNGEGNSASGIYSTILNGQSSTDKGRSGWIGYSTGNFGGSGDQQAGLTILSGSVSGSNSVVLTAGNITNTYVPPNGNNILNLVPFSVLHVKGTILGSDTATQDSGAWSVEFVIKQGGGGASETAIVGFPKINLIAADTAFVNIDIQVSADIINGGVAIVILNDSGWPNTAYWEANLSITELVIPSN